MSRGAGCGSPTTWLRSNFRHRQPEQPLRTFELGSHKPIINCSDRGYSFEAMFAASTEECQREGVGSWPDFQGEHIRPRNGQEDLIESTFAFEGKDGSVDWFRTLRGCRASHLPTRCRPSKPSAPFRPTTGFFEGHSAVGRASDHMDTRI